MSRTTEHFEMPVQFLQDSSKRTGKDRIAQNERARINETKQQNSSYQQSEEPSPDFLWLMRRGLWELRGEYPLAPVFHLEHP
jgi:hypothetical protein